MKKPSLDLIVLGGAPGTGKTTLAQLLHKSLGGPYINFGWLREWHLTRDWKNQSLQEENMAFENLVFVLQNYIKHGFHNTIVTDLQDSRVQQMSEIFKKDQLLIITLTIEQDDVLKQRVLDPKRDSGFRDVQKALAWNAAVRKRKSVPNEIKFDNTRFKPQEAVQEILKLTAN